MQGASQGRRPAPATDARGQPAPGFDVTDDRATERLAWQLHLLRARHCTYVRALAATGAHAPCSQALSVGLRL
jgi:hypothetical protein